MIFIFYHLFKLMKLSQTYSKCSTKNCSKNCSPANPLGGNVFNICSVKYFSSDRMMTNSDRTQVANTDLYAIGLLISNNLTNLKSLSLCFVLYKFCLVTLNYFNIRSWNINDEGATNLVSNFPKKLTKLQRLTLNFNR